MADIVTPITARKTEEFTTSQIELVRNSLAISDSPILQERTYIVFDADAGSNSLTLEAALSSTYSINWGDGGLPTNYNDTGGVKSHTYANAGRYLITIVGDHNGLYYRSQSQPNRDRIISVIGGSNYPTTIGLQAFEHFQNLESVIFPYATETIDNAFSDCPKLKDIYFPLLVDMGQGSFSLCIILEVADFPSMVTFGWSNSFSSCDKLRRVNLPLTQSLANQTFLNCINLKEVNVPVLLTTSGAFTGCIKIKEIDLSVATSVSMGGCTALRTIRLKSVVTINNFSNVVLTDVFVDGTEVQADDIMQDIVSSGGLFTKNSRLLYGGLTSATFT